MDGGWALIVNPAAGGGKGYRRYRDVLNRLNAADQSINCYLSDSSKNLRILAQQVRDSGVSTIIAMGGDGTIHEILNGLAPNVSDLKDISLGIVPAGNCNSFLRHFGTALNTKTAVDRILEGRSRIVDLGQVHYTNNSSFRSAFFLHLFGMGFFVDVCKVLNQRYRRWGTLGSTLATLTSLSSLHCERSRLIIEEKLYSYNMSWLAICNSQYIGGAMRMAPKASLTDGKLDMLFTERAEKRDLLLSLFRIFGGNHIGKSGVHYKQIRSLSLECDRPVEFIMDGEVYTATPVHIETCPQALRLLV